MPTQSKRPDTIVLVHGFWVTPRSWEHWITRYEAQGYHVLAPAYRARKCLRKCVTRRCVHCRDHKALRLSVGGVR